MATFRRLQLIFSVILVGFGAAVVAATGPALVSAVDWLYSQTQLTLKKVLFLPLLLAGLTALYETTTTPPPLGPVQADLRPLRERVAAKVKANQRTALALAPEIAEFDALLAKYAGQSEAQVAIMISKAAFMRDILKDEQGAKELLEKAVSEYPETKVTQSAKRMLHALSPAGKAEQAARVAADKAKNDVLMSGAAPDFTVQRFDGSAVKLSDYRGKVVVLDFWASWCGPCKAAMPHNQEVAAHYKDQDVVIFAVCVWDKRESAEAWLRENQAKYPELQWAFDPSGSSDANPAKKLYNVGGIPAQFVIGRDGRMVERIVGYLPGENILEAALSKAGVKVDPALVAKGEADRARRAGS